MSGFIGGAVLGTLFSIVLLVCFEALRKSD